jgi:hypothetical protein
MSPIEPGTVIDVTRAPRGELAAAQLVDQVANVGDLAERHFLELKGPSDLTSKADKQKVAKFILGAANRLSEKAAEAFEGCAVMVIGITANGIEGLPPIEMLELSKVVQPFLGVPGPRWDVFRVPVENSDRQVLVIVVEPPQPGQPVYICRASGDGLTDGRVYMRADGETREATSAEQDAMRERAVTTVAAPVELDVQVVGKVVPVTLDEASTLEEHISTTRARLLAALPLLKPTTPATNPSGALTGLGGSDVFSRYASMANEIQEMANKAALQALSTIPEKRTADEYRAEIDAWEEKLREAWPAAVERLAGYALDPNEISVANETQTFLHDVEVKVHLEGAVTSIDYYEVPERGSDIELDLPRPPRSWGPIQRDILGGIHTAGNFYPTNINPGVFRPSSSSWKNSGSVDVEVTVGDLRPEATFVTDDEESILVLFGDATEAVAGTWRATVRGYNEVFKGTVSVPLSEPRDLTKPMRYLLGLEDDEDSGGDEE